MPGPVRSMPPTSTLGQLMFSSSAAIPGMPSSIAAICPNSSTVSPARLTMTGTFHFAQAAASSSITSLMPTFWSPMELSMPAGVSATRGWRLPPRGAIVTPLLTTAPRALILKCFANSKPQLKVPDAGITGFFNTRPVFWPGARSTSSRGFMNSGYARRCRQRYDRQSKDSARELARPPKRPGLLPGLKVTCLRSGQERFSAFAFAAGRRPR